MASRIAGITVEINGSTTGLQKALKDVNSQIKSTQSQLKDVNKLLKLDPGNTELITQKHKLLADAVSETKEKLATLKTAAEQANTALANGEISQSQYDALQREIIETENELKNLETQANQSATALQKIAATGTKFQEVGSKITSVGQSLLPVSAAITGIGVAGLKVASDFESGMSQVKAITGATGEDFERLRDTAIDLGAKTAFSSQEVADGMTEMAKAGWTTDQIIDGMSGVLSAAAASGSDLANVSTIVADAITGFGLAASDSTRVADLLTQAANTGTIDIEDLGESFKYVAPVASAMGFSIEDCTTALAAMSTAGIKGSQAGTSLRTAFLNMASPTDAVAAAMDSINLSVTDANGNFKSMDTILSEMRSGMEGMTQSEKENVIATIAGKNAVAGLMSVVNMSQEDYDELAESMDNCSGIAEETAAVMQDNLQSKIEQLGGALESLAIKLSDYVIPFLTSLVEKLTAAVDWFTNLDPAIQKVILVIAGIVAVAGPLLIIIGKVVSAVGTIMTIVPKLAGVITTVKTAFGALNAVMLANPIVLIIAAIAALVAAFIYFWNTSEGFRQFWIDLWETIKSAAITAWTAISTFFTNAWTAISTTAQTIWSGIATFFSTLWTGIQTVFTTVVTAISTFLSTAWTAIQTTATTVWTAISTFFSTIWTGIQTIFTTVVTAIQTFIQTAWNTIQTIITTVMTAIQNVFTTVWNTISSTVTSIVTGIQNTITTIWNTISSTVSNVMNTIFQTITNIFTNIWNGITTTMGNIVNSIKQGFQQAIGYITSLPSQAIQWGKDIIQGIVNGIKSMISSVASAASSVASTIKSYLHFSVPDEGPLTDYESWMPDFINGLAKGIEDSRGVLQKAVSAAASDLDMSKLSGDFNASLNVNTNGGSSVAGGNDTVRLSQPILLDGKTITTVVSQIQYSQGRAAIRNLGTI